MSRNDKNAQSKPEEPTTEEPISSSTEGVSTENTAQVKDSQVTGSKCETCNGRGIRPEVNERVLCPDCNGSGTVEA